MFTRSKSNLVQQFKEEYIADVLAEKMKKSPNHKNKSAITSAQCIRAAIILQKYVRMFKFRKAHNEKVVSAIMIQSAFRRHKAMKEVKKNPKQQTILVVL